MVVVAEEEEKRRRRQRQEEEGSVLLEVGQRVEVVTVTVLEEDATWQCRWRYGAISMTG